MNPQPGFALLQLARGEVEAAVASIRSAVEQCAPGSLQRARLLPAQADIAVASNDRAAALRAAEELTRLADDWPGGALQAAAEAAVGMAKQIDGDYPAAARRLRQACRLWLEVDSPYEAARCRVLLAEALRCLGDMATAKLEIEAGLACFERLGARLDAERAADFLAAASIN